MSKVRVDSIHKADDTDIMDLTANGVEIVSGKDLRVDEISDQAGTGAPDFSQGIKISGSSALTYQSQSGTLNGSFTGGDRDFTAVRIGNVVTITAHGISTFSSASSVSSSSGVLDSGLRPSDDIYNCNFYNGGAPFTIKVEADGTIVFSTQSSRTDSGVVWSISYVIT